MRLFMSLNFRTEGLQCDRYLSKFACDILEWIFVMDDFIWRRAQLFWFDCAVYFFLYTVQWNCDAALFMEALA